MAITVFFSLIACGGKKKLAEFPVITDKPAAVLFERNLKDTYNNLLLAEPFGLAKNNKGEICLSDAGNHRLLLFDSTLIFQREIGGFGSQTGSFNYPTFLAFDNNLQLLVADENNRRLSRYSSQLVFADYIPFYDDDEPLLYGYPSGVAFTPYGETWVSDREKNRIVVFNNIGNFDRYVGEYGAPGGELLSPEKIVSLDRHGFLACDAGNRRMVIYDDLGNFNREIKHPHFEYPIAADYDNGYLWVLDGYSNTIFCLSLNGELLYQSGSTLPGDTKGFRNPSDILVLDNQYLLVADSGHNRLVILKIIFDQ